MAKRKNGGGEYKKVKGSSGSSSPKSQKLQERGSPVGPSVPFSTSMSYAPRVLESTPLQSRSVFDEDAPIDFSTLPTKTTFLDQIRDAVRNNPK